MASTLTRADSLRRYLTGAGSDGGAQTDPNAALGNYRSSTQLGGLGVTRSSAISNVTVDYAAPENGTGNGTLTAASSTTLRWTPPGGTIGPAVTIADGETKLLEGGGATGPNQFVIVSRTSASSLTGTETDALADVYNALFDNVGSAEATAGDDEYRGLMLKNVNSVDIGSLKVYLATLGTQAVSDSAQLGSSGSGTITTTGSFADWPDTGFCRIMTSGAVIREIVYYSSRTSTSLTIPTAGRALGGTSAAAGASADTLDAVPGIRIAKEATSSSHIQTVADENTAPTGVTWNTGITAATGLSIGTLAAGALYGLWIHRFVPAGAVAAPSVLSLVKYSFDAA